MRKTHRTMTTSHRGHSTGFRRARVVSDVSGRRRIEADDAEDPDSGSGVYRGAWTRRRGRRVDPKEGRSCRRTSETSGGRAARMGKPRETLGSVERVFLESEGELSSRARWSFSSSDTAKEGGMMRGRVRSTSRRT